MSDMHDDFKYKAAKKIIDHEGKIAVIALLIPIVSFFTGELFVSPEENTKTLQAPQALERIADEMLSLSVQKDAINHFQENRAKLEFVESALRSEELNATLNSTIAEFKSDANKTLSYILATEHLSEVQKSNAWGSFSKNIALPEDVSEYYNDDYDFGHANECHSEITSELDNKSIQEIGYEMDRCLVTKNGADPSIVAFFSVIIGFATISLGATATNISRSVVARRKQKKNNW